MVDEELLRYKEKLEAKAADKPFWEKKCLTINEAAEYPTVATIDTFYTDANGSLVTPEKLPYGKGYSLVEAQAPYLRTRDLPFEDVVNNYKRLDLPCFESIRRARQRVQSLFPEYGRNPQTNDNGSICIVIEVN